ncbi:MAG: sn-glycerol-3-phosphate ABC transporter ATP-binding protein UgpC [Acidobacteria bacterium]|nr:sn-glycerol-3-phosphate ABC transporter ATP-binding protein UgpC [Acidobacteriota bacterium]
MAQVEIKSLTKIYDGGVCAVKSASFEVADKEFVVLVGPSGCGKSTLLRMIAGLESISNGDLLIDGKKVNELPAKDRDIAMVFQNYALYPHLTVYDNMAFSLKIRNYPSNEIKTRVEEAAKILGLTEYLLRKPKALSGGQRQRVALGRAIVRRPKVFLFDEPLSNLDAKMRVQTRVELIKLHRQLQATMIYVTHDQVEAMTMADKIVVVKNGEIQQVAPPLELYKKPTNKFVAGFIGSPAMNFINCKLSKENNKLNLKTNSFSLELKENKTFSNLDSSLQEIVLGIRPEDITIANGIDNKNAFLATVEIIEQMGNEVFVQLLMDSNEITARLPADANLKIGEKSKFSFNLDKCHFFDSMSEKTLL